MTWQELPTSFEVDADQRQARFERRLVAVLRQIEGRIAEVDTLRAELDEREAHHREDLHALTVEAARWRDAHEALLVRAEVAERGVDQQEDFNALNEEVAKWREAHEALLATKTVRAARVPRALYAHLRRLLN